MTTQDSACKPGVTIGELFPADDVVGQWVFTLNCVGRDIRVLIGELRGPPDEMERQMLFARLIATRLYEARRLVDAYDKYNEIRDFVGDGIKGRDVDLLAAYRRPSQGVKSEIEHLYSETRHRTVHYSQIGEKELRQLLDDYRRFPARLAYEEHDSVPDLVTQWVPLVRGGDTFGTELWSRHVLTKMQAYWQRAAEIASAWIEVDMEATIGYAKRQGISLERLLDDPAVIARLKAQFSPSSQ
jgi:hypothetical protein